MEGTTFALMLEHATSIIELLIDGICLIFQWRVLAIIDINNIDIQLELINPTTIMNSVSLGTVKNNKKRFTWLQ